MRDIVVIGSVALDNVTTPTGTKNNILGGSCTYFSIAASFFTKVRVVATVGEDFPDRYMKLIKKFNIDTSGLEKKDGKTFKWTGSYLDDLNSATTINTELNVFQDFKPIIPKAYKDSDFLFLANIDPDLQLYLVKQNSNKKIIGCDSMNLWIKNKRASLKKVIKGVDFLFLNEGEAKQLSSEDNILSAGKRLLSFGPRYVIIKRGEYGAVLFSKNDVLFTMPAFLLEKVNDPTGAGDTFAGGFMGYLSKASKINEKSAKNALLYGSVMASFTVEDFSIDRFKNLKKQDIRKRLSQFRKLTVT